MQSLKSSGGTLVVLDEPAEHLTDLLPGIEMTLTSRVQLEPSQKEHILEALADELEAGPQVLDNGVAVLHAQADVAGLSLQTFVRFCQPLRLRDRQGEQVRFAWILLSDQPTHPHLDAVAEFVQLMSLPRFKKIATEASSIERIWEAYRVALESRLKLKSNPPELEPTGRLFGGVVADIKRRLPYYGQDIRDGLCAKTLGSALFLFFSTLAPCIAFGGLLSVMTEGQIGVVETLIGTAIGGCIYALCSGQPLTIVGSTGPTIIFLGILYDLCQRLSLPYLPTLAWIGLWTSLFLVMLTAVDGSTWMRFFSRFTDDTFAALIAMIFIAEALKDMFASFGNLEVSNDTALLSLILSIGTFWIAITLSRFRQSVFLRRGAREFLADFGPAIAIGVMTAVAAWLHQVEIPTLTAPAQVATSTGRPWMVNLLDAPSWVWLASAAPALLATILVYLDQNITVRLVNSPQNRLQKGGAYHLDLVVVALMIAVFSLFGLPWLVAATVRSLNHVRSLANVDSKSERITSVVETRLSGLAVHLMLGCTLLLLPWVQLIPLPVLFGLFLYMGVAAMGGNSFFQRLSLWAMDPTHYPPTHYLRAVPVGVVHRFTAIQALCLAVMWVVKASVLAVMFPLLIAGLVPIRMSLDKFFKEEHIALLDGEEEPQETVQEPFPG